MVYHKLCKINKVLCWSRQFDLEESLDVTIKWYKNRQGGLDLARIGRHRKWMEKNYRLR